MATKYIAYGGCPPGVSQTSHSLHTAVLQGIAVFFSSTLFFLFLHPFSQNSTYCCLYFYFVVIITGVMRSSFGERIFYLSENGNGCRLTYSGTLPAGDLRPSGFSRKFRRNGGLTAWTLVRKKYGFVVNS